MSQIHKAKIVFFGTPEFAAIVLERLINASQTNSSCPFSLDAIVTAPDKPIGRKQVLTPPPVKTRIMNLESGIKNQIKILQPENLKIENWKSRKGTRGSPRRKAARRPRRFSRDLFGLEIRNLNPDVIILAAYGQIIPKEILEIPKYGCLNIHPSLLPKYRGASPIQAVILNGEKETGVTIILMDEKIDHGPIVAQRQWEIRNPKSEILNRELAELGADLLIKTLPKWLRGEIKPVPQNHSKATFTKIIKKEDGKINWRKSAVEIERMTRAYQPWPSAYTQLTTDDKQRTTKILKVIKAKILNESLVDCRQLKVGQIFLTENKKLAVACQKDVLILEEVQIEGKKIMTGGDFFNGYPWVIGSLLN